METLYNFQEGCAMWIVTEPLKGNLCQLLSCWVTDMRAAPSHQAARTCALLHVIRHIVVIQGALRWPSPHLVIWHTHRCWRSSQEKQQVKCSVSNCTFAIRGLNHGKYSRCLMLEIHPKLELTVHFRKGEAKNLHWQRIVAHTHSLNYCKRKIP